MKQKKEDRRIQRTRKQLRDALVVLILEKGYEAVTVQNILDRANLGRSTFYSHYRDKEALLLSGFEELHGAISKATSDDSGGKAGSEQSDISLALFRHAADYHPLYKAMVGKQSGYIFLKQLQLTLVSVVSRQLEQQAMDSTATVVPLTVVVQYFVSSLLGLLTWWLDHDLPYPAEEMDAMFKLLTLPGRSAALR